MTLMANIRARYDDLCERNERAAERSRRHTQHILRDPSQEKGALGLFAAHRKEALLKGARAEHAEYLTESARREAKGKSLLARARDKGKALYEREVERATRVADRAEALADAEEAKAKEDAASKINKPTGTAGHRD